MAEKQFELKWDKYALGYYSFLFPILILLVLGIKYLIPEGHKSGFVIFIVMIFGNYYYLVVGILGSLFFFKKYFDKRPPLVLNDEGITSRVSGYDEMFITWTEIEDIEWMDWSETFFSTGGIQLLLADHRTFNNKLTGLTGFVRRLFRLRRVNIDSSMVLCDYEDLKTLLRVKLLQYKNEAT